jgi:small subunit ribosomal protein S7
MSRRHVAAKREILPDPKFGDRTLAKFINMVMSRGKKAVAESIVYGALDEVEKRGRDGSPLDVLKQALDNVEPKVEVKSRRVGGATYQVPVEVRPNRRMALAMRWLVDAARKRSEKSMGQRLANEILEASDNRGTAVKKREDTHKMAEANRAFSHYRW